MELVLVRHALPERVIRDDGQPADPPLSAEGHEQARRVAAWLAEEDVDAIYTSPLRRAVETAEAIAAAYALDAVPADGLAEFDRLAAEYIPIEELKATNDPRWQLMVEGRYDDLDADPLTFRAGVVEAVEAIVAAHPGGRVVAVAHGGVINGYLGHVLGIDRPLWFHPGYTSISRVAASRRGHRSIVSVNEVAHLRVPL